MPLEEPLQVGDYVLLHIGFVMSKIDEEEAQASLESFRQMVAPDAQTGYLAMLTFE